ncbi:beta-1,3-galactosyltransferase 5-like [Saccostrea cucullata]|uniref:beta-1,3-galactosyltransferase 5-like n=1 Tax=Saccostrea cuccullata TaxID=36930 RepID=UPI002ED2DA17
MQRYVYFIYLAIASVTVFVYLYSEIKTRNQFYYMYENRDESFVKEKRTIKLQTKYPLTLQGEYIINNKSVCRNTKKVSVLVMVHTAVEHFGTRSEMRTTWLNITRYRPEVIRVIFLVGTTLRKTSQEKLEEENALHHDIIQGDFKDTYRNLTNKGVMGLRWVTENCMNAEVIVKIDDDSVINFFKFFENFSYLRKRKRFLFCHVMPRNAVRIERDKRNKWFVSDRFLKGFKLYPYTYCSGFAVFISKDLIPALYKAAMTVPFFWVDDVYLFGILPSRLKNVVYTNMARNMTINPYRALDCYRRLKSKCNYLAMQAKGVQIRNLWNLIEQE